MCTVTINIDEAQVRKAYPELTSMEAITRWAQHLVDTRIADLVEIRSKENLKPYTIEELHARIRESEADFAAGRYTPAEDLFREWDEEIARWEAEEEYPLPEGVKPYTMEEINARIDKAERDSAEGRSRDFDDFMRELRQQFAEEDMREEMEMLEVV